MSFGADKRWDDPEQEWGMSSVRVLEGRRSHVWDVVRKTESRSGGGEVDVEDERIGEG
jgi:hypothetical protein